jgi:hypothetical protein
MTVNEKSAVSAHTEADTETEAKTSSLPSPGGDIHVRARTRVQEDPATATAKILESGNKKIQGCDQDAVRKALADGDLLALVRAYGANDSRGHEWARDAAGRKLGRIAIVLDWAQRSRRPIREPSGLRSALVDWDSLLSAEQIEISQEWAEGLGIRSQKADSVPQEAISPQDPAQDRGEEDRAAESRETALEGKQPQPHESAREEKTT